MTGDAVLSEFLIGLFACAVLAITFRRNTPRSVELLAWAGLVWVCIMAVAGVREAHARALTSAAVWGASQLVGTLAGFAGQGVTQWLSDHRFAIAEGVVLVAGICLLVLVLLYTRRQAAGWQPKVRLRDWMELPRPEKLQPAPITAGGAGQVARRLGAWAPVAATSAITWLTLFLSWTSTVLVPSAANGLRTAAGGADGGAGRLGTVVALRDGARHALTEVGSAPEMNWLGGIDAMSPRLDGGIEDSGNERDPRHQLAS